MVEWLARDSHLWRILFYGGLILQGVLAAIQLDPGGPAAFGIPPLLYKWMILVNSVTTAIGGKYGMSPVELKRNM